MKFQSLLYDCCILTTCACVVVTWKCIFASRMFRFIVHFPSDLCCIIDFPRV